MCGRIQGGALVYSIGIHNLATIWSSGIKDDDGQRQEIKDSQERRNGSPRPLTPTGYLPSSIGEECGPLESSDNETSSVFGSDLCSIEDNDWFLAPPATLH